MRGRGGVILGAVGGEAEGGPERGEPLLGGAGRMRRIEKPGGQGRRWGGDLSGRQVRPGEEAEDRHARGCGARGPEGRSAGREGEIEGPSRGSQVGPPVPREVGRVRGDEGVGAAGRALDGLDRGLERGGPLVEMGEGNEGLAGAHVAATRAGAADPTFVRL